MLDEVKWWVVISDGSLYVCSRFCIYDSFFMPSVTSFVAAGRWFFQKYMNFVAQQVIE